MEYQEGLNWIHDRMKFGIKPGVKRMEWMLGQLDNPERNINGIHIVGTNGKGSTVAYMRNALNRNGYAVGTFTSPYIETFNERISVDGHPITDEQLVELIEIVKPISEELERETDLGTATEFEIITTMMFVHFGTIQPVDYVLVEAGLGAKKDSTNVFNPILTVLTSIGLDHTAILGDTLLDITKDKSGVIKPGVPLVFSVKDDVSRDYIHKILEENGSKGIELNRDIILIPENGEFQFQYGQYDFQDLKLSMPGRHQKENASLAIAALIELYERKQANIDCNLMIQGIEETVWPGRIEVVSTEPLIILDGAHNNEAVDALVNTMTKEYPNRDITVLFSAIEGKPIDTMIGKLESIADSFNVTEFDFPKALDKETVFEKVRHPVRAMVDDYEAFLDTFDGDVLLVTGSLYFISEVKQKLNKNGDNQ